MGVGGTVVHSLAALGVLVRDARVRLWLCGSVIFFWFLLFVSISHYGVVK